MKLLAKLGLKLYKRQIGIYYGMGKRNRMERKKNRKPFFSTKTGGILKGVATIIAPNIVGALEGVTSIPEAISTINNSALPDEKKVSFRELILREYETEVMDRTSAREREVRVLEAGGGNYLMKVLGWTCSAAFLVVIASALGVYELPENINRDFLMFGAGAVVTAFTQVLNYYYGSSSGSARKNDLMFK